MPVPIETPIKACKHLVGFIDHTQIEGLRRREPRPGRLATELLAAQQKYTGILPRYLAAHLDGGDPEQIEELLAPLPEQRLGGEQQDPARALRPQLRHHQPRLDGLPETDLVREDAAALAHAPECKNDGVDLMRIRIDAAAALRGGIAATFGGAPQAQELFSDETAMDGMRQTARCSETL